MFADGREIARKSPLPPFFKGGMTEAELVAVELTVLQVTQGLGSGLGGTAVFVAQLSNQLVERGVAVSVVALSSDRGEEPEAPLDPRVRVHQFEPRAGRRLGFSRELGSALGRWSPPDLVHIHGLWQLHHAQVARYAFRHRVPIVVSTHGMLEPWALQRSRWIKRIARVSYQDRILARARCLHTTAPEEAVNLRRLGLSRPIAVIPLGVEVPSPSRLRRDEARFSGLPAGARVALFLSRLHPKKGLDLLLHAWSKARPRSPEWVLAVAGYDAGEYRRELVRLAVELGVEHSVVFTGPVRGEEKESLLGAAELFVLPSRSENFGLVVPEALARGLPVITTTGTPWSGIAERGCGWWVEVGVEPLARALEEAMRKSREELRQMGRRGVDFVRTNFSPETSAQSMLDTYRWVLGKIQRPAFVLEARDDAERAVGGRG